VTREKRLVSSVRRTSGPLGFERRPVTSERITPLTPFLEGRSDGVYVWVTGAGGDTVTKLRASDGSEAGTYYAGSTTIWTAFDGANIWVTNFNGASVTKL
jgi:hypothetical protein